MKSKKYNALTAAHAPKLVTQVSSFKSVLRAIYNQPSTGGG